MAQSLLGLGWGPFVTTGLILGHYVLVLGVIARVLLRHGLAPVVRLSWIMLIALVPLLGVGAYVLFGEIRLNRAKGKRIRAARARIEATWVDAALTPFPAKMEGFSSFAAGRATGQLGPVEGNRVTLLPEGDAMLEDMITAINEARSSVHILFYIWLPDGIGRRVAQAVSQAAARGVKVRVLVDAVGSRHLIKSPLWAQMQEAGVETEQAMPLGNPLFAFLFQRLDVRNHRKIVVVDNRLSWVGSRNCADEAFAPKAKFAPWIDVLTRVEGPVVRQLQAVFFADWLLYAEDAPLEMLASPQGRHGQDVVAQVIASGPQQSEIGMSETICTMCYSAQSQILATTPYYLPDAAVHQALLAAARRGVKVVLILPARNDSRIIAAASFSMYESLLRAGVQLLAYEGGLIHSKILTIDGDLALIGSANLDRRSFDLNYECSMLLSEPQILADLDARQALYQSRSRPIALPEVTGISNLRRAINNLIALAGPLL